MEFKNVVGKYIIDGPDNLVGKVIVDIYNGSLMVWEKDAKGQTVEFIPLENISKKEFKKIETLNFKAFKKFKVDDRKYLLEYDSKGKVKDFKSFVASRKNVSLLQGYLYTEDRNHPMLDDLHHMSFHMVKNAKDKGRLIVGNDEFNDAKTDIYKAEGAVVVKKLAGFRQDKIEGYIYRSLVADSSPEAVRSGLRLEVFKTYENMKNAKTEQERDIYKEHYKMVGSYYFTNIENKLFEEAKKMMPFDSQSVNGPSERIHELADAKVKVECDEFINDFNKAVYKSTLNRDELSVIIGDFDALSKKSQSKILTELKHIIAKSENTQEKVTEEQMLQQVKKNYFESQRKMDDEELSM